MTDIEIASREPEKPKYKLDLVFRVQEHVLQRL